MFADGNKTIMAVPIFLSTCIYIGISPFDQTVHEDSNNMIRLNTSISFLKKLAKPKLIHVRIEISWYGSSFIWTSTGTDGSQNYLVQ